MSKEERAGDGSQRRYTACVECPSTRDGHWTTRAQEDPMLARIDGIAWVEQVFPNRGLDWVAPSPEVCEAWWGDRCLARVVTTRV